jgi:hypothetical protein
VLETAAPDFVAALPVAWNDLPKEVQLPEIKSGADWSW